MHLSIIQPDQKCREDAQWYVSKFINHYGSQFENIVNDYAALRQVALKFGCRSVLEIGTWMGYSALWLWLTPGVNSLTTIDFCHNYGDDYDGGAYHRNLPESDYGKFIRHTTPCEFIRADVNDYDWKGRKFDMVFVDGGHALKQVRHDVALAIKLASNVVACHDLNNGNPGVDQFFKEYEGLVSQVVRTSVAIIAI